MKNLLQTGLLIGILCFLMGSIYGQSITGKWQTIDDESGNPVSYVEITENNGKYYGKVVKLLPDATVTHCDKCKGDNAGKPIEGMQILWDLKKYKDYWSYGHILDPKSGKTYKCSIWLDNDSTLTVRGYLGISLLGRSQNWYRVEE